MGIGSFKLDFRARIMAVRLFEAKDHAASYLRYRVSPHELITRIMDFMEEQVCVLVFLTLQFGAV